MSHVDSNPIRTAAEPSTLTAEERARYARHLILPEVGEEGQARLKAASVLLVGLGGLGSPAAYYLAAAGVGTLGLVDFDAVDASNLQRQILHFTPDVGRSKLDSAVEKLAAVNPYTMVRRHETRLTAANARDILAPYDVVLDGTDNFATRYLVNDACVLFGKPNVYGSIFRFEGQASVFDAMRGPCYRCLYPEPPPPGAVPNCAEAGVLGVLPGIVGAIQANEAIKLILGAGSPLIGRLLLFDALAMRFREVRFAKDPQCPLCSESPSITSLIDYDAFCGTVDSGGDRIPEMEPRDLAAARDRVLLIDVREPHETRIADIPGGLLIPLGDFADRMHEIPADREVVVFCRSGKRSAAAVRMLLESGRSRVWNLRGGILAWSDDVDPTVVKY